MRGLERVGSLLLLVAFCPLLFVSRSSTVASVHPEATVHSAKPPAAPSFPERPSFPDERLGVSQDVDEDEESEFEAASEDLPIPSAFAPRPTAPPSPPPPKPRPAAAETRKMGPTSLQFLWQIIVNYKLIDVLAAVLLLAVVVVAIMGKGANTQVAADWMRGVREVLDNQFASVADGTKGALTARSYNTFELFCSGRRNCMFMLATLDCRPRQCLWRGHLLRAVMGPSGDLVTLEFVLPEEGEGVIINICRKQEQRSHFEAAWDITEFCKVRHGGSVPQQLPEGFVMMADTQEAAERLFEAPGLQKHLAQLAPYLKCIYTSDLCTNTNPTLSATIAAVFGSCAAAVNKPKRVLRMSYYLPDKEDFDHRLPIAVACKLVDVLANLRLSEASREAVRKLRLAYEKEQQKQRRKEQQELAEKRRAERKKEQEKALENLPEEQRRKAQEAQERRAVKEQRKEMRQGVRVVRA